MLRSFGRSAPMLVLLFMLAGGARGEDETTLRSGVDDPAAPARLADAPIGYSISYEHYRKDRTFRSRGSLTLTDRRDGRLYLTLDAVNEMDRAGEKGLREAVARGDVELLENEAGERVIRTMFVTTLQGQIIEGGSIYGVERYAPHSCEFIEGLCRFTLTLSSGRVLRLRQENRFENGVWRYAVSYDPKFDPQGRSDEVYTGAASIGADGMIIDNVEWRAGEVTSVYRRTSPTPQ